MIERFIADDSLHARAVIGLWPAQGEGDDVVISANGIGSVTAFGLRQLISGFAPAE